MGKLIDGMLVSQHLKQTIRNEVSALANKGIKPCLATVLVGNNQASATYVKSKQIAASSVGILTRDFKLPENISQEELVKTINELNHDENVHGILIQLPLPNQIETSITNMVNHEKDVDGLTSYNLGLLLEGTPKLVPCTPLGILELLDYYNINVKGIDVAIINRSNLVGKPLGILLMNRDATVTFFHSKSKGMEDKLKNFDCIITAVGDRQKFTLTSNMVKDGAIIFDVGISRINGKIQGDVDFKSVSERAGYITPVPGGVGPMTVTMLLKNTVHAARLINKISNH
ncbi:MAG: bifunctional 5,10-methylenetetrahydrofolate dehydrogenase/5,10-methenyltetrahydrofolate cyclohydrolase [Nitrososphaeraceae archaeon]|nr:bifunctional 5,10-methylenetetrahydrofolate dehydrogenase/5,10-methenyltetrahydrofolate cyclohydrolase [Nitrososphaeraceae archaeon]MDW0147254.1 bifunctional 5,10-methylenetetrahydrofolate dehydrogenase/5,10-methenyltetrahydrofolate cyclohydrolase [Nitrososphaeraceae archaeon]